MRRLGDVDAVLDLAISGVIHELVESYTLAEAEGGMGMPRYRANKRRANLVVGRDTSVDNDDECGFIPKCWVST